MYKYGGGWNVWKHRKTKDNVERGDVFPPASWSWVYGYED